MNFLGSKGSSTLRKKPQSRLDVLHHIGLSGGAPRFPTTLPNVFTGKRQEEKSSHALVWGDATDQLYHNVRCPSPIETTESRHLIFFCPEASTAQRFRV